MCEKNNNQNIETNGKSIEPEEKGHIGESQKDIDEIRKATEIPPKPPEPIETTEPAQETDNSDSDNDINE